jgi:hypothetical protein
MLMKPKLGHALFPGNKNFKADNIGLFHRGQNKPACKVTLPNAQKELLLRPESFCAISKTRMHLQIGKSLPLRDDVLDSAATPLAPV